MLIQSVFGIEPGVASTILSLAIMLLFGFLMTRVTKLFKLPNVTAYILTGILIGPYVFNLIPDYIVTGTDFLPDLALAFIAFSTGEFFKLDVLRKNGMRVVVITLFESLLASLTVFCITYFALGLTLPFSIVLAALASATAPASTVMTIRQTGAHGDFVDSLLQIVALDDVVGLVAFSVAISIATALTTGTSVSLSSVFLPMLKNLAGLILGAAFGFLLKIMIGTRHSSDNRLIISIALLFGFCGICALFDVSPLLGCMAMGTVYVNTAKDDKLFKQLNYFTPPILLLFFVRSGVSFRLSALFSPDGAVGTVSLLTVGILYFLFRIVGKYGGAWLGCLLVKKPANTRRFLGLALIPQAGVAIGLAALGARTLGGDVGNALQTIILSSSILYELIGPGCAKLSLHLSGSYSDKIEEIVPLPAESGKDVSRNEVDALIERIRIIQSELPPHEKNEEEAAFTEAAEEQYETLQTIQTQRRFRNRRFF